MLPRISIVRHLRSVHGKTKEPSEKEKKELIKIAKEKTRTKRIELLQEIELLVQSSDSESELLQKSKKYSKKDEKLIQHVHP